MYFLRRKNTPPGYAVLFFFIITVGCQSPQLKTDSPPPRGPSQEALSTVGPIDDCLQNAFLYSRDSDLESECTLNYVHYYPRVDIPPVAKKEIQIGSFNLFHLGDNQAPLKNLRVVAQIMNQWDLVGAQELMPLAQDHVLVNKKVFELVATNPPSYLSTSAAWSVEPPGYIALLEELRKLDPSWSLILQSQAAGEGSSGEMAGFYYRRSVIRPQPWDYCPREQSRDLKAQKDTDNLGCLVQVPQDKAHLVSRMPFASYFKSGDFDFIALSTHVRFRPVATQKDLQQQTDELCENFARLPNKPTSGKNAECKPTKDNVGRFYEVKMVAEAYDKIIAAAKDQDFLFMGDFNIELNALTKPYWDSALLAAPQLRVYQEEPTTVAVKQEKILSNYDHFILSPQVTTHCDAKSAKSFNMSSTLQSIGEASRPEQMEKWIQMKSLELKTRVKVGKENDQTVLKSVPEKELESRITRFQKTKKRAAVNIYGTVMELISDHLPISMKCSISKGKN